MAVTGKYVLKFSEATHALPEGMSMNADYPFMLPRVIRLTKTTVTIQSDNGSETRTVPIEKYRGQQVCYLEQVSSFERMTKSKPHRFRCFPFKDQSSELLEPAARGELF